MKTHLPPQAYDLYLADAADFSQGWEDWSFMYLSQRTRGWVGCVAGVFLWCGLDNLIQENDEECR